MNKATRLAKIESALKPCERCTKQLQLDAEFTRLFDEAGLKASPKPKNIRVERCWRCGTQSQTDLTFLEPADKPRFFAMSAELDQAAKQGRIPSKQFLLEWISIIDREHANAIAFFGERYQQIFDALGLTTFLESVQRQIAEMEA